jgi:hypothetical protein
MSVAWARQAGRPSNQHAGDCTVDELGASSTSWSATGWWRRAGAKHRLRGRQTRPRAALRSAAKSYHRGGGRWAQRERLRERPQTDYVDPRARARSLGQTAATWGHRRRVAHREHLDEQQSQGVDVGPRTYARAEDLLRRGIGRRMRAGSLSLSGGGSPLVKAFAMQVDDRIRSPSNKTFPV